MIHFNLLKKVTFINPASLLRNTFVALSLGAFLISPTYAGLGDQDFKPNSSSALVPASHAVPSDAENDTTDVPTERVEQDANSIASRPIEVLERILQFLPAKDASRAKKVCVNFHEALSGPKYDNLFQLTRFLRYLQTSRQASPLVDTLLSGPLGSMRLSPEIFEEGITELHLDSYIGDFPDEAFDALGNIQILHLNDYTGILPDETFSALGNLTWLSLDGYTGSTLPDGIFSALESLTHLDLNDYTGTLPNETY